MLLARFDLLGRPGPDRTILRDAAEQFRKAYYDTAQAAAPGAFAAAMAFADPSRILFGSDRPFAAVAPQAEALRKIVKDRELLRAIFRDNALAIMPALGAAQV
jgi:predicted TIM-barrel fold metal-dependent hydrolase